MENKTIKQWSEEERPREKIKRYGIEMLSEAELLAVMLGSGTKDKNVVELSREILDFVGGDLDQLARLTLHEFQSQFKGIGEAKAMHLLATLEFGRRRNAAKRGEDDSIRTSKDIVRLMHPVISDMPVEECREGDCIDLKKMGKNTAKVKGRKIPLPRRAMDK